MVVIFQNSSGSDFWLPVYAFNDKVYQSHLFYIFAPIQILIYILTAYIIIKTCIIFLSIKVFHENMNILIAWFLLQWFEAIIAKFVIFPYQFGLINIGTNPNKTYYNWWTDDRKEMITILESDMLLLYPLFIASYLSWHYMYSILFGILGMGIERVFATYYVSDYEHVRRRQIPCLLIILTNLITLPYAYQTFQNKVSLVLTCVQCSINGSLMFIGYLVLWNVNLVWRKRICSIKNRRSSKYTLAKKFQIEENIKSLLIARKLVIAVVIYISLVMIILLCQNFEISERYDSFFATALENSYLLAPVVMSVTLIFCSPVWKLKFLSEFPIIRRFRKARISELPYSNSSISASKETDVYFEQLRNSWN